MGRESSTSPRVYRVGIHLVVVLCIFASLFGALGLFTGAKRGDWTFLVIGVGIPAVLILLLQVLRLEITLDGFKYRNLSGSREVAFKDVSRAYFEVVQAVKAPQGVAIFWVERRDGKRVKINLRTFNIEAAAVLFNGLEAHGIEIGVPAEWAARRMADQVRAAQAKMRM
jgi:hypothetical protein